MSAFVKPAAVVITCFIILASFTAAGLALYDRFSATNSRVSIQKQFNAALNEKTSRNTCAIRRMITDSVDGYGVPNSPQNVILDILGITGERRTATIKAANAIARKQLATLPKVNCSVLPKEG